MKVKLSLIIMIRIGNGFPFRPLVVYQPRGVQNVNQFDSKFLQDYFRVSEVEKTFVLFLEQNGWGKAGRVVQ
jgi:hypothetical protein